MAEAAAVVAGEAHTNAQAAADVVPLAPLLAACRNCGYSFSGFTAPQPKFCPQCGQDTHPHAPSFWAFVHEFITHYVALEGKLWKTLGLLFLLPGQLTRHYSAGRKLQYVAPLRLYITASFLFFLVVKVAGFGNIVTTTSTTTTPDAQSATQSAGSSTVAMPPTLKKGLTVGVNASAPANALPIPKELLNAPVHTNFECKPDDSVCLWLEDHLKAKWEGKTSADAIAALKAAVISNLPFAMFFMLPVFAGLTYWLYWRRGLYFGEHMVYAMHVHAFAFFTLLTKAFLPRVAGDIVLSLSLIYYFIAMQRYFGGRWWATGLRYALVGTIYPALLVMLTGGVIILSWAI